MRKINILHLSDTHINKNEVINIQAISKYIVNDIKKLQKEKQFESLDLICFTGDLINSGQNDGELYNVANNEFLMPLINGINLSQSNFFMCQGNHENDLSLFDEVIYDGLKNKISNTENIKDMWASKKIYNYLNSSVNNFNDFFDKFNSENNRLSNLTSWAIRTISDYSIGIVVANSTWNSCGNSEEDYGKLLIGFPEIEYAYTKIAATDLKIIMFHHPIEQLCEVDRIECEKLLNKFDIVLNGHTHLPDQFQKFSEITNTLYLCAGQLNDTTGERNGYSLIEINPYTKDVTVSFRKYFSKRKCFGPSLDDTEQGCFVYNLNNDNIPLKESYQLAKFMLNFYKDNLREKLITNILYGDNECKYIEPLIKNHSNFTEYTNDDEEKIITIDEMIKSNINYWLFGKINYGKSTTLNIIAYKCCCKFELYQKLPIVLDFKKLDLKGKKQIFRGIRKLLTGEYNCEIKIKDDNIEEILKSGYIIILIDNFDVTDQLHKKIITQFMETNPNVNIIITQQEDILNYYNLEHIFDKLEDFEHVYLQPVPKKMIINFAEEAIDESLDENTYNIIEKTTNAISELGMGKTPFNIIMLLNIYRDDNEFTVISEANVVERFMELLLEKINVTENDISSFDFRNKEDFLISIADYMLKNDKFTILKSEYDTLIDNFFKPHGLDSKKSNFETLFFDKKILVLFNDEISFNYKFILDYYIAKSFVKFGLPDSIYKNYGYLKFVNELNYYSGFQRDANKIFYHVKKEVENLLEKFGKNTTYIDNYDIDLEFEFNTPSKHLNIEEKSELSDKPDRSQNYMPNEYSKKNDITNTTNNDSLPVEIVFPLLSVFGRFVRNMDYLPIEEKIQLIKYCINVSCIILNDFCEFLVSSLPSINEMFEDLNVTKEILNGTDVERMVKDFVSMLKMTMPIAIESLLHEWIGNKKLLPVFETIKDDNNFSIIGDFIFSILYLDLRAPNSYENIRQMIKNIDNKSLLKLIYAKLISIYMLTTSSYEEKRVESLIADLVIKQNPTKRKGKMTYGIDRNKTINNLRAQKQNSSQSLDK